MVSDDRERLDAALSAVMDGRATPAEWALVNAAWPHDPVLRERWAAWQLAGDGLRSSELPAAHRDGEALLAALHARMPAAVGAHPRRREWLAPLAVAAGFVIVAVGVVTLRPAPVGDPMAVAGATTAVPTQGLVGSSFAQTAAGRTLPPYTGAREAGLLTEAPPEIVGWGPVLPAPVAPAASRPRP